MGIKRRADSQPGHQSPPKMSVKRASSMNESESENAGENAGVLVKNSRQKTVPAFRSSASKLTDSKFLFEIESLEPSGNEDVCLAFTFCLDNSSSMERLTEQALLLLSPIVALTKTASSVVVFSEKSTVFPGIKSPEDMKKIKLPAQGMTNITGGLNSAFKIIVEKEKETKRTAMHHVLVFLSDGDHNIGHFDEEMRNLVAEFGPVIRDIKLSCVIVGVSASSRTSKGMIIKENFETVCLPDVKPIYFCEKANGMADILHQVVSDVSSEAANLLRTLKVRFLPGAAIIGPMTLLHHESATVAVSDGTASFLVVASTVPSYVFVQGDGGAEEKVEVVVGVHKTIESFPATAGLVEDMLARLSIKNSAATCSKNPRETAAEACVGEWIDVLQDMATAAAAAVAGTDDSVGFRTSAGRLAVFSRERSKNFLREVTVLRGLFRKVREVPDDSSEQARYLVGASAKYAAKARRRAGPVADFSVDSYRTAAKEVAVALREDLVALTRRFTAESLRAATSDLGDLGVRTSSDLGVRTTSDGVDAELLLVDRVVALSSATPEEQSAQLDEEVDLRDFVDLRLMDIVTKADHEGMLKPSFLSLLNAGEQLREWLESVEMLKQSDKHMKALMLVSAPAFPIVMRRCAGAQLNPYLCTVDMVSTNPLDTGSLMCAMESGIPVKTAEGFLVTDALVLINPLFPKSTRKAYWSPFVDWYYSTVVTRSLYMYNVGQRRALHELSFVFAAAESSCGGGEAYTRLALNILYSMREHFGAKKADDPEGAHNKRLLRWLGLGGITDSKEDGVDHWAQLVLALAMSGIAIARFPTNEAKLSLALEIANRDARLQMNLDPRQPKEEKKAELRKYLCGLLDVSSSTSPTPTAIGVPDLPWQEVKEDTVRKTLAAGAGLCEAARVATESKVRNLLERPARSLFFAESLLQHTGGWREFKAAMETGRDGGLVGELAAKVKKFPGVDEYFGLRPGRHGTLANIAVISQYGACARRATETLASAVSLVAADPASAVPLAADPANAVSLAADLANAVPLVAAELKMDFYDDALALKTETVRKDSSLHMMIAAMACKTVEEFESLVIPPRVCKKDGELFGCLVKPNAHSGKDRKGFLSLAKAAHEKSLVDGDARFMEAFSRLTTGDFYEGKHWKSYLGTRMKA